MPFQRQYRQQLLPTESTKQLTFNLSDSEKTTAVHPLQNQMISNRIMEVKTRRRRFPNAKLLGPSRRVGNETKDFHSQQWEGEERHA